MFDNLNKYRIVLASNSPRRCELLRGLGIEFDVKAMKGVDESRRSTILAEIDSKIRRWIEPCHGILFKLERDRYIFIFEEQLIK